jgi:hypothetical protein
MRKLYYIGHFVKEFNDGGQSRNKAFLDAFLDRNATIVNVFDKNFYIRFLFWLNALKVLLFSKGNDILIHQGSIIVLFPLPFLKVVWLRKIIFKILQKAANFNTLTIEVNDLPYEQSKDLELQVQDVERFLQDGLYSLENALYIFASYEMGKYAFEKYSCNYKVIINGSSPVNIFSDEGLSKCFISNKVKFIYAGGLNKGRQIELLISKFQGRDEILILIGEMGEWLSSYELSDNIFYLGKYPEDYAHYLTSKCDVGIIPYDENRWYYNICYPTKASFYITAGIPFLSTPLIELKSIFEKSKNVYFIPFNEWSLFLENLNLSDVQFKKNRIAEEKSKFYWSELMKSYFET